MCLISDEGMGSLTKDCIEELSDDLAEFFEEVNILVYLRRQIDLIVSGYSTRLRSNDETKDIERLVENYHMKPDGLLDFYQIVEKWCSVVQTWPYTYSTVQNSVEEI
ncbi:MAG: hypothetical protein NXH95_10850 [Pseudomonadaceae bacterium]|nr:hypothetical protein [Pseudomonadaceae bacterium]